MWQDYKEMFAGRRLWRQLKRKYRIGYDKVVIFVPETDLEWNYYALAYLNDYQVRKSAEESLAFISDEKTMGMARRMRLKNTQVISLPAQQIKEILKYYCFDKFFDNVSFFYLDYPRDNKNRLILEKSKVSKEELVCLAFYCLRQLPEERHIYIAGEFADV